MTALSLFSKHACRTLAGLICLLAAPLRAEDNPWHSAADIRETATRLARSGAAPDDRVEAALDERLRLPRCGTSLEAFRVASAGTSAQTIGVRCTAPAWSVYVPVRVNAVREVLVAARPLARGATLSADALRTERREISGLQSGYLPAGAAVAGKQLTRFVAAGSPLLPADVAAAPVVRRGQQVTLVGRVGGLEVRAPGKALADAAVDQRIKVENLSSRRTVEGTVRSADTVEVGL